MLQKANSPLVRLVAETILAFLFWGTLTTAMGVIWFLPLDSMRLEPYVFLFVFLVPALLLLLCVSSLHPLFLKYQSIGFFLALAGIASYFAQTLEMRLGLHFCSYGLIFVFWLGRIFYANPKRQRRTRYALLLGILASLSARFGTLSLYPFWLGTGFASAALVVGGICTLILAFDGDSVDQEPRELALPFSLLTDLRFGIGFGCLYGMTHNLLSTPGMLARWIDLDPFFSGILVILSAMLGLLLGFFCTERTCRSARWYHIGVGSSILVMILPKHLGAIFGYILVIYIMSIWNISLVDMSRHARPGATLLFGFFTYFLFQFANVWSIAWCFVPPGTGGPFMRQRIPQVICFAVAGLGFAYYKRSTFPKKGTFLRTYYTPTRHYWISKSTWTVFWIIVCCILLPSIAHRTYHVLADNHQVPTNHIKAMVWAIRFGYDNQGWPSFHGIEDQIRTNQANVISLVETDIMRVFTGPYDGVEFLENKLHMYSDYGPSTLNDTWGCALLSAFPIIRSDKVALPSPEGETACLIDATLNVNGRYVDVISAHVGNTNHYWDRELQIAEITRRATEKKAAGRPLIFLGYLTAKPHSSNYNKMVASGLIDTSPNESDRYCLYHFYHGLVPGDFRRIPHKVHQISDTEIQIADYYFGMPE